MRVLRACRASRVCRFFFFWGGGGFKDFWGFRGFWDFGFRAFSGLWGCRSRALLKWALTLPKP